MKITKRMLKQLIKEELSHSMRAIKFPRDEVPAGTTPGVTELDHAGDLRTAIQYWLTNPFHHQRAMEDLAGPIYGSALEEVAFSPIGEEYADALVRKMEELSEIQ